MMIFRLFVIKCSICLLLVAGFLLMGSVVWAAHDLCGNPSESRRTADSDTGTSPSDSDCACACCQADTMIPFPQPIRFQIDPLWSIETTEEFAASWIETDIFRPPLA